MTDQSTLEMGEGATVYGLALQAIHKALSGNGPVGGKHDATSMQVTQSASPAMTVLVLVGAIMIDGVMYPTTLNYGNLTLNVTAAHATLNRRDLIYYDVSERSVAYLAGTASADANPPSIPAHNDIPLAIIYVGAAVTNIVNADIIDIRSFSTGRVRSTTTPSVPQHIKVLTVASDTVQHTNATERSKTNTSFAVAKKTIFYGDGPVRVKYDFKNDDGATTVHARLYVNDVAVGTDNSTTANTDQTKTENVTLGFGDEVQVYVYTADAAHPVLVNDLIICYDLTMTLDAGSVTGY